MNLPLKAILKRRGHFNELKPPIKIYDWERDLVFTALKRGHVVDEILYTRAGGTLMADAEGIYHGFTDDQPAITNLGMKISPEVINRAVGVVDAGGSIPAGWVYSGFDLLEVLQHGVEDGLEYIEIRAICDNIAGAETVYPTISTPTITVLQGDNWTGHCYYKHLSGAFLNNELRSQMKIVGASGTVNPSKAMPSELNNRIRLIQTAEITETYPNTLDYSFFKVDLPIGESFDVTFRLYAPQLEIGSYANDPVVTGAGITGASAAITASDDISEFKLTQLSLYTEFNLLSFGEIQGSRILQISGGNVNNQISFRRLDGSDNIAYFDIHQNGENNVFYDHIPISTGNLKILLTISETQIKIFINGVLAGIHGLFRPCRDIDLTQINFGSSFTYPDQIIANFKKSVLYDIALDDAICVELTS